MLSIGRKIGGPWLGLVLLIGLLAQLGCTKQPDQAEVDRYSKEIEAGRTMKDNQFRMGRNSPLTAVQRQSFEQLHYFPVDYNYRVNARYVQNPSPALFAIQTSSGKERVYARVGRLDFKINGIGYSLMAYQSLEEVQKRSEGGHLFVPFTDATSGGKSYGGGRYLDIPLPKDASVNIDFNLAYNPYCAYNSKYSCPIPPRENRLPVEIVAGEQTFK